MLTLWELLWVFWKILSFFHYFYIYLAKCIEAADQSDMTPKRHRKLFKDAVETFSRQISRPKLWKIVIGLFGINSEISQRMFCNLYWWSLQSFCGNFWQRTDVFRESFKEVLRVRNSSMKSLLESVDQSCRKMNNKLKFFSQQIMKFENWWIQIKKMTKFAKFTRREKFYSI